MQARTEKPAKKRGEKHSEKQGEISSETSGETCNKPSNKTADKPWTPQRLAQLEQLWSAGATAQAIAAQLGVSRSAVMGKLFRLRKAAEKLARKQRGKKRGLSLFELTDKTCRWPIGEPGSDKFHFCGEPGADLELDQPYCAQHRQRAYVAKPAKKPESPFAAGSAISPGISAAVRRMFRDATARRERT